MNPFERHNPDLSLFDKLESKIEYDLRWQLFKYAVPDAVIKTQEWVNTPEGNFRPDFTVYVKGRAIVIECDGKEFHVDKEKDAKRDEAILAHSQFKAIYRIRGKDIWLYPHEPLLLLSAVEPSLFSERGVFCLSTLSHWEGGVERHGKWEPCAEGRNGWASKWSIWNDKHDVDHEDTVWLTWRGTPERAFVLRKPRSRYEDPDGYGRLE